MASILQDNAVRNRKAGLRRKERSKGIEPIPAHRQGTLPVSELELDLEKLAGADQKPELVR